MFGWPLRTTRSRVLPFEASWIFRCAPGGTGFVPRASPEDQVVDAPEGGPDFIGLGDIQVGKLAAIDAGLLQYFA